MSSRQSDWIRARRNPKKGRYERERIESILDRGLVAHVARASRIIRLLAGGAACLAVAQPVYEVAVTNGGSLTRC